MTRSTISEPTRAALAHDRPRIEKLNRRLPFFLRKAAREAAALPGTRSGRRLASGSLASYAVVVASPVQHWPLPRLAA